MFESLPMILTYIFLVSTMLAIGLTVTGAEILNVLEHREMMVRVLVANLALVPALGYLLIAVVPLSPGAKLALALLALAPGGLTAIQFTGKVKGNLAFAAAVAFLLTLLSIFVTPLLARAVIPRVTHLDLPFMRLIETVLAFLLLPLMAGFIIRKRSEKGAAVLGKIMLTASNVFFVATVLLTSAMKEEAMRTMGMETAAAMLLFVVCSMAIGWFMGGPDQGNRRVLAIATSMRNAGLCLIGAMRSFPGSGTDVAVIAFMGLMVPPNMLFTLYHVVREKLRKRRAASPKTPDPQIRGDGPDGGTEF